MRVCFYVGVCVVCEGVKVWLRVFVWVWVCGWCNESGVACVCVDGDQRH